jgi:hypothetical protein
MITRRTFLISPGLGALPLAGATAAPDGGLLLDNLVERDRGFVLTPGPKVEGVVFLQGGYWKESEIAAFHQVPWIDAASVRMEWQALEPRPGEFNWKSIDRILFEVKKYNAAHPGAGRTLQIRVMGGEHCPKWFEQAGVRYYDTFHPAPKNPQKPVHAPLPYDNPEFLKRLRLVYRAMYERYKDEPLVALYHGTWSAGPWDEIFHPVGNAPLPPGYTPERFTEGMMEQADVLLEEFSLKGKPAELPFTGVFPDKRQIDFLGPITARIVERLGRRSPYLYIQSNGWGIFRKPDRHTIAWGHERDIDDAYGQLNLALQAIGTNAGGGWIPQGDWIELVKLAERYEAAYTEIYPPDFMPVDNAHHMEEAFTQEDVGFRPWLRKRNRVLYVREGTVRRSFRREKGARPLLEIRAAAAVPAACSTSYRARTRRAGGAWSDWAGRPRVSELPAGDEVEVEAKLRTDDGYFTPRVIGMEVVWG